ncbi:hypothetical protein [Paenibacillus sacheonensis]|uniref:Flagellar protein FliT n=1 Tax=Paenibacillus sacheonensis TaxID=742054 RepID=A0A7X4YVF1_9BACL|nr:hypothetical protein [Paenibacillus sacheonensis]MBM7566470.1 hypothetical protein [Paenibacillus sacheonensis]NBC73153.1 hypothetical protein [Paenibacillus sacheonensis]
MGNAAIERLHEEAAAIMDLLADVPYERLVQLVELRESTLMNLQETPVLDENDRMLIRQLMKFDGCMLKRMQELKEEASERISKIQSSKMQKQVYENDAFEGGFFFDKRK